MIKIYESQRKNREGSKTLQKHLQLFGDFEVNRAKVNVFDKFRGNSEREKRSYEVIAENYLNKIHPIQFFSYLQSEIAINKIFGEYTFIHTLFYGRRKGFEDKTQKIDDLTDDIGELDKRLINFYINMGYSIEEISRNKSIDVNGDFLEKFYDDIYKLAEPDRKIAEGLIIGLDGLKRETLEQVHQSFKYLGIPTEGITEQVIDNLVNNDDSFYMEVKRKLLTDMMNGIYPSIKQFDEVSDKFYNFKKKEFDRIYSK